MKYWRRKQFLAVLMVFSLIGTAGSGRVSGTGPNGRGVEEKESVVPEENGGKATPENYSEREGGNPIAKSSICLTAWRRVRNSYSLSG